MAPQIPALEDLSLLYQKCDEEFGEYETWFTFFDKDDTAYFGKSDLPKRDLGLDQLAAALKPIPDEHIFPSMTPQRRDWTYQGPGHNTHTSSSLRQTARHRPL